jgi:hypothetical protein
VRPSTSTPDADEDHDGESVAIPIGVGAWTPDGSSEAEKTLARLTVRRYANQHGCCQASTTTACIHPDHRRDVDYARWLLTMLGL